MRTKASPKNKFESAKNELRCYLGQLGEGRSEKNVYSQSSKNNNDKVPNCSPGRHAFLGLA